MFYCDIHYFNPLIHLLNNYIPAKIIFFPFFLPAFCRLTIFPPVYLRLTFINLKGYTFYIKFNLSFKEKIKHDEKYTPTDNDCHRLDYFLLQF